MWADDFNEGDVNGWNEVEEIRVVVVFASRGEQASDVRSVSGEVNWTNYLDDFPGGGLPISNMLGRPVRSGMGHCVRYVFLPGDHPTRQLRPKIDQGSLARSVYLYRLLRLRPFSHLQFKLVSN
jgi:hypothetical protein